MHCSEHVSRWYLWCSGFCQSKYKNCRIKSFIKRNAFLFDSKFEKTDISSFENSSTINISIQSSANQIKSSGFAFCRNLRQVELPKNSSLKIFKTFTFFVFVFWLALFNQTKSYHKILTSFVQYKILESYYLFKIWVSMNIFSAFDDLFFIWKSFLSLRT